MLPLGQEDKIEEIILRPAIWWYDVVYQEVNHCMKWPHSANVRIFWSRPAEGAVVLWTSCFLIFSCAKQTNMLYLCVSWELTGGQISKQSSINFKSQWILLSFRFRCQKRIAYQLLRIYSSQYPQHKISICTLMDTRRCYCKGSENLFHHLMGSKCDYHG